MRLSSLPSYFESEKICENQCESVVKNGVFVPSVTPLFFREQGAFIILFQNSIFQNQYPNRYTTLLKVILSLA